MVENYKEAAFKHWNDARLLEKAARNDNADHHFGIAAECALKYALRTMGVFREDKHRKHINVLWSKMQATAFHRTFPGLARYLAGANRFADWCVDQRYYQDGHITTEMLTAHRDSARRLLIAVDLFRG